MKQQLEEVRAQLLEEPHARQLATLTQLSEQALVEITEEKCQNWFTGATRVIPRCITMDDIFQGHNLILFYPNNIMINS